MKYLVLSADYTQFPLKDEFDGIEFSDSELLGEDTVEKIEDWNGRYRELLPLSPSDDVAALGLSLDEEGMNLAKELEIGFKGLLKVKYWSAT